MSQEVNITENKDFSRDWVASSRTIFYVTFFALTAFVFGASVRLYQQRYKGKPDIEIQGSTKYTPEYK
jgi:hypothetical protein